MAMHAAQAAHLNKVKKSGMIMKAAEVASLSSAYQVDKIAKAAQAVTELGVTEAMHAKHMAAVAAMAQQQYQENAQAAMHGYQMMQNAQAAGSGIAIAAVKPVSVVSRPVVAQPVQVGVVPSVGIAQGGAGIMMQDAASVPVAAPAQMGFGIVSGGIGARQCICPPIYDINHGAGISGEGAKNTAIGFGAKLTANLAKKIITDANSCEIGVPIGDGILAGGIGGIGGMDINAICMDKIKEAQSATNVMQRVASGGLSMCLDTVGRSDLIDSMIMSNIMCYC